MLPRRPSPRPLTTIAVAASAMLTLAAPAVAQDSAPDIRATGSQAAADRALVSSVNAAALDLYRRSISPDENLFLSPVSVSTALGLAYRGARGATAAELRAAMQYPVPPETYLATAAATLRSLEIAGEGRELHVANALWVQRDLPLRPDFTTDVAAHANGSVKKVDFRRDPDAARVEINKWVATGTKDRIVDLLQPSDVHEDTRVALINSIYWRGIWQSPFRAADTQIEPFVASGGRRVPTRLMHQTAWFALVVRAGVEVIQLPYEGGEVAMVVLLPHAGSGLRALERSLTAHDLDRWLIELDKAKPREIDLTLPRIHLTWRRDLVPTLRSLGVDAAFTDRADFSGMVAAPPSGEGPGGESWAIGSVIHQTFLDINEQGSEAAAATAVVDVVITGGRVGPPPIIVRADHPFLFLLRDQRTGAILFIGRYVAPERS